ncbi:nuclear transport factor 2 family protein [Actinomadura viridis]|uniref:SnoaL-like aldol condensation-catalyzing enzyme n=1 Tax=Actinomadura viridis TaxID=58110 RepID=A0A931GNY7_9ACTN|nr:ester cyclase [Actinomadura viridis]MBG6086869.1 putative SnoaL-like aldol condensation-catalyzing enzyme [Actinomadura viridis]
MGTRVPQRISVGTEISSAPEATLDYSTPVERENLERVENLYQKVIDKKNLDAADEFFGAGFVQHNPLYGEGVAGFKRFVGGFFLGTFPDLTATVDLAVCQNDRVLAHVHWAGHDESGREFELWTADLYRFQGGRAVEHWDVIEYTELVPWGPARPDGPRPRGEFDLNGTPRQLANLDLLTQVAQNVPLQDLSRAHEYFAEDFFQHDRMIRHGLDGFKECCNNFLHLAPDMVVDPRHVVVGSHIVGTIWDWKGHKPDSDVEVVLVNSDCYRIEDGKFTEHWPVVDYTSAIEAYGYHPKDLFQKESS